MTKDPSTKEARSRNAECGNLSAIEGRAVPPVLSRVRTAFLACSGRFHRKPPDQRPVGIRHSDLVILWVFGSFVIRHLKPAMDADGPRPTLKLVPFGTEPILFGTINAVLGQALFLADSARGDGAALAAKSFLGRQVVNHP